MAHTNSTPYFNLPQFIGSDKASWLTDVNGAFSSIDTAMHENQNDATDAVATAGAAEGKVSALQLEVANIKNSLNSWKTYTTSFLGNFSIQNSYFNYNPAVGILTLAGYGSWNNPSPYDTNKYQILTLPAELASMITQNYAIYNGGMNRYKTDKSKNIFNDIVLTPSGVGYMNLTDADVANLELIRFNACVKFPLTNIGGNPS